MFAPTRILAIDPGEKRLGLAISDPTGTIANPLKVIEHQSREKDVQRIIAIAENNEVTKIIVGQALDWDGAVSRQGKKSYTLATSLRKNTHLPVILWNEYGSTQAAQEAQIEMGLSREKRGEPVDHLAATLILQSYLDAQENEWGAGHE